MDLVTNRHGAYDPAEVRRVLRPGGKFITQQVGGSNQLELNRLLGAPEPDRDSMPAYWNLQYARCQVEEAGLLVLQAMEVFPPTHFFDVGAVVFWLTMIPWQIPDFSVDRYFDRLKELHQSIQEHGSIEVTGQRFLIVAEKPGCSRRGAN